MDERSSHASGMLWALKFHEGRASHLAAPAAGPVEGSDWTWTHFPLGDMRARAFIAGVGDLPAAVHDLIDSRDERLQLHGQSEWAFGVLPDLERDLAGKPLGAGRLYFAMDGRRLITARLHPLRIVDDVRRAAEQGLEIDGPASAIVALIERYHEILEARLETLTDRLDTVEDLVLSEPGDLDGRRLGPFRRELVRHRREFQSLRSALSRARLARGGRPPPLLVDHLGALIAPIEDLDQEAAGLQERARLLHEEIDTLITSATNRSMRTLTVISTLLIPPTLIVGAFGMNVQGMPFAHSHAGFALASFVCLAVVGGALVWLRRLQLLP